MPNAWISFVKDFSDKKKMKYNDAMKSAECKEAYNNQKPKSMETTPNKKVKMPKMPSSVEAKVRKPRMKKVKEVLDKLM